MYIGMRLKKAQEREYRNNITMACSLFNLSVDIAACHTALHNTFVSLRCAWQEQGCGQLQDFHNYFCYM